VDPIIPQSQVFQVFQIVLAFCVLMGRANRAPFSPLWSKARTLIRRPLGGWNAAADGKRERAPLSVGGHEIGLVGEKGGG
jgi:hypothetical protein